MRKLNLLILTLLVLIMASAGTSLLHAQEDDILEQEEEVLEFLENNFPRRHDRMMKMRKRSPKKFRRYMKDDLPRFRRLRMMKEADPDEFQWQKKHLKQRTESHELVDQYFEATDADKPQIKTKIKEQLSELFDLKHKHQQQRVKRAEKKLTKLQRRLERRVKNRDQIIEKRLNELLSDYDDLTW